MQIEKAGSYAASAVCESKGNSVWQTLFVCQNRTRRRTPTGGGMRSMAVRRPAYKPAVQIVHLPSRASWFKNKPRTPVQVTLSRERACKHEWQKGPGYQSPEPRLLRIQCEEPEISVRHRRTSGSFAMTIGAFFPCAGDIATHRPRPLIFLASYLLIFQEISHSYA